MPSGFRFAGATVTSAVGPPDPWHSYLRAARSLMPGVEHLPTEPGPCSTAHAFLCAQIVECTLKAIISFSKGGDDSIRKQCTRHSLIGLWKLAVAAGLAGQLEAPEWLMQLDFLHNKPFYLRYQQGIHTFAVPNPEPARTELRHLLKAVGDFIPTDPLMGSA